MMSEHQAQVLSLRPALFVPFKRADLETRDPIHCLPPGRKPPGPARRRTAWQATPHLMNSRRSTNGQLNFGSYAVNGGRSRRIPTNDCCSEPPFACRRSICVLREQPRFAIPKERSANVIRRKLRRGAGDLSRRTGQQRAFRRGRGAPSLSRSCCGSRLPKGLRANTNSIAFLWWVVCGSCVGIVRRRVRRLSFDRLHEWRPIRDGSPKVVESATIAVAVPTFQPTSTGGSPVFRGFRHGTSFAQR